MTLFEVKNASCGYLKKRVLENIGFSVGLGEVLCILGANGVGKSTLFKSILGLIPMQQGCLCIEGEDVRTWTRAEIAHYIGYVPQISSPPFSYSVMDVALMGRTAYLRSYESPKEKDIALAESMIETLGITRLTDRSFLELSGGEKQLVLIARALTQEPKILIMDEPTTGLDFGNQQMVLEQVQRLARKGLAVIMSSHFPDHAFSYSDKVLMLKHGGIYAQGPPKEVITETSLDALYEVEAKIINTGIVSKRTGAEILSCIPVN